jgi:hypothetical protein
MSRPFSDLSVLPKKDAYALSIGKRCMFPSSQRPSPPTEFRAFADGERLCFAFEVSDDEVVGEPAFAGESTVDRDDRVELLLARDAALERHYYLAEGGSAGAPALGQEKGLPGAAKRRIGNQSVSGQLS